MSQTFQVGQRASVTRTISESDVYLFAGITGDLNPAHTNEEYAKKTHFKTRIAHGMLSSGLVSALLGMELPGPGTIYTGQTLKFLAPVHIGDTITATAEIQSLDLDRNRVVLTTTCTNQDGRVVITGEATALLPRDGAAG